MPSLGEAYESNRFGDRDPTRVVPGVALGIAGALAVIVAIALLAVGGTATTFKAYAGLLAGVGVPAMLLGVVFVLPAEARDRLGVLAGTLVTTGGVWLFWHAYPTQWTRTPNSMAFETVFVYALGAAIALWFVFTALATTRLRNNPQGTVRMELVRQGETKTVEVSRDRYRSIVSDGGESGNIEDLLDE
jgi:hypothetical protein